MTVKAEYGLLMTILCLVHHLRRILFGGLLEPTRHNLWPLALMSKAAGSVLAYLAVRLSHKRYQHAPLTLQAKK